jgi:hypothetical protein
VLAFLCLAGSLYQSTVLVALVKTGKRADAEVVRIETGVKGGKRAVLQFVTDRGDTAVSRDLFEMMLFRFSKGDRVTVLYDPADTGIATIDLGLWTWQQPVLFFSGFVLLLVLGIMLPRLEKRATGHD